jgi:hypothetical protein
MEMFMVLEEMVEAAALKALSARREFDEGEREAIAAAIAAGLSSYHEEVVARTKRSGAFVLNLIANLQEKGQPITETKLEEMIEGETAGMREGLAALEEEGAIRLVRTAHDWSVLLTPQGEARIQRRDA